MGLKSTRKLISIVLSIIIAISSFALGASVVLSQTFVSESYVQKHFVTEELVSECEKQLQLQYLALEKKSNIPARVFQVVETDYPAEESINLAISNFFVNQDSTLYSKSRITYFYGLCEDYLKSSKIDYNKEFVTNTAQEAAQIYSNCFGIRNVDGLKLYISNVKQITKKIISFALVIIAFATFMIQLMYKKKPEPYYYLSSGIIGGGFGFVLLSLCCMIFKVGADISVTPVIYQQAFYHLIKSCYGVGIITGAIIIIIGIVIFIIANHYESLEEKRKNIRFSKRIGKF